jgi:hemerythrin superfamily protein
MRSLPATQEEGTVDAIQTIKRDHREVERLFVAFERAHGRGDLRGSQRAVRDLVRELSVHAVIEEQLLYPALRRAGVEEGVLDALEEHHAAKLTLKELDALPPQSERYAAKVRVLEHAVREHVAEEERELLPALERELDPRELRELGDSLRKARRAAPTRPHPLAPDTPPGVYVAGALAAVWDRSRDAARGAMEMARIIAGRGAERSVRATRDVAKRARREGEETLRGARERGEQAVEHAVERGWEAVEDVADRGRWAMDRVEERSATAARTVRRRATNGVRAVQGAPVRAKSSRRRSGTRRRAAKSAKR